MSSVVATGRRMNELGDAHGRAPLLALLAPPPCRRLPCRRLPCRRLPCLRALAAALAGRGRAVAAPFGVCSARVVTRRARAELVLAVDHDLLADLEAAGEDRGVALGRLDLDAAARRPSASGPTT